MPELLQPCQTGRPSVKIAVFAAALLAFGIAIFGQTAPTLTKITPPAGMQGRAVPVTLTGTNFNSGMPVVVNSSAGIQLAAAQIVNSTTATAVLVVDPAAPEGARSVYVIRSGIVSNPVKFTVLPLFPNPPPAPAPVPTPAPIPIPAPLPLTSILLDNFESGLRVIDPSETVEGGYRFMWSFYQQDDARGAVSTSSPSYDGAQALKVHVTADNAYVQFFPYIWSSGGFTFAHKLIQSGTWTNNTINRMRIWVKPPPGLVEPAIHFGNLQIGTYTRASSYGDWNQSAELGGNHYYHGFNIPAIDGWYQIIIDTHADQQRGADASIEWNDISHPTKEPGWNYFDALTRFYADFVLYANTPLTTLPGDFYFDKIEFFREDGPANTVQVHSLAGGYVPASNRLIVRWQRPKADSVTKHEVRYAFSSIYTLGWDNATPAPNGLITPPDTGGYTGMGYDTTAISMAGHETGTIYVAIKPVGASTFNQITVPLSGH